MFNCFEIIGGEYDTLERRAGAMMPGRMAALRGAFVDPSTYQEAMFHVLSYLVPTDSDDPACANHSVLLQQAYLDDQLWALKMLDASTKLSGGFLEGNFQDLGNFDECLGVEVPDGAFSGQLCVVQTTGVLPHVVANSGTSQAPYLRWGTALEASVEVLKYSLLQALPLDVSLAVCVPSSCSASHVERHWDGVMREVNASAAVDPVDCSAPGDSARRPTLATHAAMVVLACITLLVVASTVYDYRVSHQPTKEKRILVSFSAHGNLRKLFGAGAAAGRRQSSLAAFDGVRVLAIAWIALGHRFEQSLQVPNRTLVDMERYTTAWFMAPILNMMLAVELFFLLSGCLLTYNFLQSNARGEKFNLLYFYYKRYIRLTPALAAVMLLEGCLMPYASDGPLWKRLIGHRARSCQDYWLSSLLYVSNYLNPYRTCVLQSWYLSADMQLYFLSPLLLIPLAKSPKRGLLLIGACYIATTLAAFANAYYLQLPAGSTVSLEKKTERNHGFEYVKTHLRAASWLTGVALGYVLFKHKEEEPIYIPKRSAAWWWLLSISMCTAAVYSITPFQSLGYQYWPLVDSLHIALHRNLFSLGATGIILLCICGRGGCVKDFLGWRGFRPLATLVYGVYLSHMGLQMIGLARARQPYALDMFSLFSGVASDLLMANLLAVILYVFIEAPFSEIGLWLYNPGKQSKIEDIPKQLPTNHEYSVEEKQAL